MPVRFCLLLLSALLVSHTANGQESDKEADPVQTVRIQIVLVESAEKLADDVRGGLSGASSKVLASIAKLESEQKVTVLNHVDMTVLESCKSMLQIGESTAVQTGSVRQVTGRTQKSYQTVETGTIVKLMPKVNEDRIVVDLDFSKSLVEPPGEAEETPPGVSQLTHQTTLQIRDGNAMPVGAMLQRSGEDAKQVLLVVAAEIVDASGVQMMKMNSSVRGPQRSSGPIARVPSRALSTRPTSEEYQERMQEFAKRLIDRADSNQDGEVSEDESSRLGPFRYDEGFPVANDKLLDWITDRMQRGARGFGSSRGRSFGDRTPGGRRPTPPRESVQPDEEKESEDAEKAETGDEESGKES